MGPRSESNGRKLAGAPTLLPKMEAAFDRIECMWDRETRKILIGLWMLAGVLGVWLVMVVLHASGLMLQWELRIVSALSRDTG